jgi:histidine triad (HIT) family protein
MNCSVCDQVKEKRGLLFEDDDIAIILAPKPAVAGHAWLVPKKHAAILEQVPDPVVGKLLDKANKVSIAVFETLGAQGTNIIISNGVAAGQAENHCAVNVLPRRENDGLDFTWQTKQLSEEEMSTIELKLKDETKNIGAFEQEKPKPKEAPKPEEIKKAEDEINYLIEQLKRVP